MQRGRYYLARVIKSGQLNQETLQNAIMQAPTVELGQFEWTITDVVDGRGTPIPYIYGNLAKYSREGHVTIVNESAKQQRQADAPGLLEASSPFVYLPEFSGLAFMHVWNGIQENVFPRRFKSVIEAAFDNFFVGCTVEPIADYRAFLDKLRSLEVITELSAKVNPPNPLFGRLWGSLEEYVKRRHADEVVVKETSSRPGGLFTELPKLIESILKNPKFEPAKTPDITDAAMLMAADGYGAGKATGTEDGREVVVKTSDSQKSFLYDKTPNPLHLAIEVHEHFQQVSDERDMEHG